jgi:hypothetical protein
MLQSLLLVFAIYLTVLDCMQQVNIFHFIDNALWGEADGSALQGTFDCRENELSCKLFSSDCKTTSHTQCLKRKMNDVYSASPPSLSNVVVLLYNIHSWGLHTKWPHSPDNCLLPSHYTIAESEESHGRFQKLFKSSFVHFDGNSTTSPFSTIQRSYFSGLNASQFLPLKSFKTMISGASFVASTCHKHEGSTKRVSVVMDLQRHYRVDSLGKCHTTKHIPEGIVLSSGSSALENLQLKQHAISNYLFYLAFENTYERGYGTEKVLDALIAGTVPVYLGPSVDCRPLLPSPNAAIFFDDFNHSVAQLSAYLQHLSANEAAYEEHRAWRRSFDPARMSRLFTVSWPCRMCQWAAHKANSNAAVFGLRNDRMKRSIKLNGTCV